MSEPDLQTSLRPTDRPLLRGLARWSFLILVGIIVVSSLVSRIWRLPTNATGNYFRGQEDIEKGDYEAAITSFSRAIQLDRNDAEAYKSRGYAKNLLGDHAGALSDYQIAVELTPFDSGAYVGRGYTRDKLGDLEGALADYDRALTFKPNDTEAYINRSGTADRMGDEDRAIDDLTRALQIDPGNGRAHLKRGSLHFDRERWMEAMFDLRQGFERVSNGPARDGARVLLWAARARSGDPRGADAELDAYAAGRSREADGAWLGLLAESLAGRTGEAELLAAAGKSAEGGRFQARGTRPGSRAREAAERQSEALFYAAEKRLLGGDESGALDLLRKCRSAGAGQFYAAARSEAAIRNLLLGMRAKPVDDAARSELPFPGGPALLVTAVREQGPASRAGVAEGDVIVAIDGSGATPEALRNLEASGASGAKVELGIVTGGEKRILVLTMGGLRPASS